MQKFRKGFGISAYRASRAACLLVISAGVQLGCTGAIMRDDARPPQGGSGGSSSPPGGETRPPAGPFGTGGAAAGGAGGQAEVTDGTGPMPLRRLSRSEYDNTLRDLLNVTNQPGSALPSDAFAAGGYVSPSPIGKLEAQRFADAAEAVAKAVDVSKLVDCAPATGDEACAQRFVTAFGRRAYRRPLQTSEVDGYIAYYRKLRGDLALDFQTTIRDLVAAMLQAPSFVYHWELGLDTAKVDSGMVRLNPHETASRLSYFLWGSMPDADLFAAADAGKLSSAADVEAQARRMIASPKARESVVQFHRLWLRLDKAADLQKDTATFPEFDARLAQSIIGETEAFVTKTVFEGDARLATLLAGKTSYLDARTAQLYGVTGVTGDDLRAAPLPADRAGLFTQASFLATQALPAESHPIKRGHFLLIHALCETLPPMPDDVPPPREPSPNLSTRERYAEHGKVACARACHEKMDPLGFAFEHFDGLGKFRGTDGGKPVDASGTVEIDGKPVSFTKATDLVGALANSDAVRACFTRHWFGFALGRTMSGDDAGSMNRAHAAFAAKQFDVRELLVAATTTRSFLYRTPAAGEVTR